MEGGNYMAEFCCTCNCSDCRLGMFFLPVQRRESFVRVVVVWALCSVLRSSFRGRRGQ